MHEHKAHHDQEALQHQMRFDHVRMASSQPDRSYELRHEQARIARRFSLDLTSLPTEILTLIVLKLDTYTLLQLSRTNRHLRALCLSPLLHEYRLKQARTSLSYALAHRQPKSSLTPPQAWIYLSQTNVLSRSISKSLIRIRLNHNLERRPEIAALITRNILPEGCGKMQQGISGRIVVQGDVVEKSRVRDRLRGKLQRRMSLKSLVDMNIFPGECAAYTTNASGTHPSAPVMAITLPICIHAPPARGVTAPLVVKGAVSPQLVETRRKVMRENLKARLRNWVENRALPWQRTRREEFEDGGRVNVKALVKRLTSRALRDSQPRSTRAQGSSHGTVLGREEACCVSLEKKHAQLAWGREMEERKKHEERVKRVGGCSAPTRAHVLGLKRFWEGVSRAQGPPVI